MCIRDSVRMNHYIWDDNVFIRSMGSHGDLGGLARKAQDVGDVLAASGKDVVIFETVGVGQGELDVAKAVDLTIVVLVPESGDEVQLMKAGLVEIADIFVVNKSDRQGADRLAQSLKSILHSITKKDHLEPPIYNTSADRNEGILELYKGLTDLTEVMVDKGLMNQKYLDRHRNRVLNLIQDQLLGKFWTQQRLDQLEDSVHNLSMTDESPYKVAKTLLDSANE